MRVGKISLMAAVAVFASYASAAAVAWGVFRLAAHVVELNYIDVLRWPFQPEVLREKRGRQMIADGLSSAAKHDWRAAVLQLRSGLSRSPEHLEARRTLARLYLGARRPQDARALLITGLSYARKDAAYVRDALDFLLHREEDNAIVALASEYLSQGGVSDEVAAAYRSAAGWAAFFRGHFDEAENWLAALPSAQNTVNTQLLQARIEWERGYPDLALAQLASLRTQNPSAAEVYDTLIRYLREQHQFDAIRQLSLAQQIARPDDIRPRIDYLAACEQLSDRTRARTELTELLRESASNREAAAALGEYAAQTANLTLARTLAERTPAAEPWSPAGIALIETLISCGEFKAALTEIARRDQQRSATGASPWPMSEGLQAVAYAGANDRAAAQLHLSAFLNAPDLRAEALVAVANRLIEVNAVEEARQTLQSATRRDPLNQAALMRLVRLDIAQKQPESLYEHLRAYVRTRRPSHELLTAAEETLSEDALIFWPQREAALELLRMVREDVTRHSRSA